MRVLRFPNRRIVTRGTVLACSALRMRSALRSHNILQRRRCISRFASRLAASQALRRFARIFRKRVEQRQFVRLHIACQRLCKITPAAVALLQQLTRWRS